VFESERRVFLAASPRLKPLHVRVSRLGMGIPVGSELEFVDEATMMEAMEGRRNL
jgi:recombination protein RecR